MIPAAIADQKVRQGVDIAFVLASRGVIEPHGVTDVLLGVPDQALIEVADQLVLAGGVRKIPSIWPVRL
ncbi:MAG: hypothetical protein IH616_15705 [Gemmatimonadales bacterium]|nr:hypothetical protein [Gemmatimonadales bacterium]